MAEAQFEIRPVDPLDPVVVTLVQALDDDLYLRYPSTSVHGLDRTRLLRDGGLCLVAFADDAAIGCGALRWYSPGVFEIKRMYVVPQARRRGVARQIVIALEKEAIHRGARQLLLETGDRQPEAIALYHQQGFADIDSFGEYVGDPHSRCMTKSLMADGG